MLIDVNDIVHPATCRCRHSGEGPHPCHAMGYTCRKPAQRRFYNAEIVSLAGMQMKFQVTETWACDECWEEFLKKSVQTVAAEHEPVNG